METNQSIRVSNLTRTYGDLTAIKDVNFSVNRGEVVGFLGPMALEEYDYVILPNSSATSGSAWVSNVCVAQHPYE